MQIETMPYTPESVGYDRTQLGVFHEFLQSQMDKGVLRAANYALSRDEKPFAGASFGKLSYDPNDTRPLQLDSIFPICSTTKLFTAAAIFKLVEQGKVRMSQPVQEFIPEFAEKPFDGITIVQLLTHTSGFAIDPNAIPYEPGTDPFERMQAAFDKGDRNWIRAAMGCGLHFTPGSEWGYSTVGYMVLAQIIRIASGQSEADFVKQSFFDPCGMKDTSYGLPKDKLDRVLVNKEWQGQEIEHVRNGEGMGDCLWALLPCGGSGIYSTTPDLMRFGNMLLSKGMVHGKRVLGRKTVEKMCGVYTEKTILDKCWGNDDGLYRRYGIGPDMRCNEDCLYSPETFFHEGAGRCVLIIDPTERLVAVYLIPYTDPNFWDPVPIWNAHSVIWAGLF